MIKALLLFCLLLSGISQINAQTAADDTLSVEDGFFGTTYKQGAREVTSIEFENLLKANPDTTVYQRYSSGSSMSSYANIFGFAGGFGLGYGLFSKPMNATSIVIGGIATVAGIVLDVSGRHKMRDAVDQYNQQYHQAESDSRLYPFGQPNTLVAITFRF